MITLRKSIQGPWLGEMALRSQATAGGRKGLARFGQRITLPVRTPESLRHDFEAGGPLAEVVMPRVYEPFRSDAPVTRQRWEFYKFEGTRRVPVETSLMRSLTESGREFPANEHFSYVRLGPWVFCDPAVSRRIPSSAFTRHQSRCFTVPNFVTSELGKGGECGGFRYFSYATLGAVLETDFSESCVVDAGAGEGWQALGALERGARWVTLVDHKPEPLARASSLLRSAGYRAGTHFEVMEADLNDTQHLAERIPTELGPLTVISNIGFWPDTYDISNFTAIELVQAIERRRAGAVQRLVLGGYSLMANFTSRPDGDLDLAATFGFRHNLHRSQVASSEAFVVSR